MKKILFTVCTHGNELAGLKLFLDFPYGRNHFVEWEVVIGNPLAMGLNQRFVVSDLNRSFNVKKPSSYEEKRAELLKKRFQGYDVLYDIHTTQIMKDKTFDDCIFVNNIDKKTITQCKYLNSKHIIWDSDKEYQKQYVTSAHPIGITLEYQKTGDSQYDWAKVKKDFENIISQKEVKRIKMIYEADRSVAQKEREKFNLSMKDFVPLTYKEKELLGLPKNENYVPVFVNPPEVDPKYYCFLNKETKKITSE